MSRGSDEEFRQGFAERTGYDDDALAGLPVLDPAATGRALAKIVKNDSRVWIDFRGLRTLEVVV